MRRKSWAGWLLLAVVLGCGPAFAQMPTGWNIDGELKFHFAFFTDQEPGNTGDFTSVPWYALSPAAQEETPDITNIDLQGIRGLGFPLPARNEPGKFTFYLKFFRFPEQVSGPVSAQKMAEDFLLNRLKGYAFLRAFLLKPENLLVKKGFIAPADAVFGPARPYPPLLLPQKNHRGENIQRYFDRRLPFYSLYVTPGTPEPAGLGDQARAEWSAGGVREVHRQLLAVFRKQLEPVPGLDSEKHEYFRVPETRANSPLVILQIPREPMVFAGNFRDLPMPSDPAHVFLSGLLLVFRHEYQPLRRNPDSGQPVDTPEFLKNYERRSSRVLEVGSVVRF